MPTVLVVNGYRFYFYAIDCAEPRHIHVERGDGQAKYWLEPLAQVYNHGCKRSEIRQIERLIAEQHAFLIAKWNEFC